MEMEVQEALLLLLLDLLTHDHLVISSLTSPFSSPLYHEGFTQ